MKTKKLVRKLNINKSTITNIDTQEQQHVKGGGTNLTDCYPQCTYAATECNQGTCYPCKTIHYGAGCSVHPCPY